MAFTPLKKENYESGDEHLQLIKYVLGLYKGSIFNVWAVIADNSSLNKALALEVEFQAIGCASSRRNLAVKTIISQQQSSMNDIKTITNYLFFLV